MSEIIKDEMMVGAYTLGDESTSFSFKKNLRATEKVYFVNMLSELLIGDNYNSVLRDLLFDFFIIDVFTDIDTSWMYEQSDGEDYIDYISKIEDLVCDTNIAEIVKANMEDGLLGELLDAVELNIEYRTGIHKNPISESIANLVKTLEKKVGDFNVDMESVTEMMGLLGGISNELTMENMLSAYAKSDMYKKNQAEVAENAAKREAAMKVVADNIKDANAQSITPILSPNFEV